MKNPANSNQTRHDSKSCTHDTVHDNVRISAPGRVSDASKLEVIAR